MMCTPVCSAVCVLAGSQQFELLQQSSTLIPPAGKVGVMEHPDPKQFKLLYQMAAGRDKQLRRKAGGAKK